MSEIKFPVRIECEENKYLISDRDGYAINTPEQAQELERIVNARDEVIAELKEIHRLAIEEREYYESALSESMKATKTEILARDLLAKLSGAGE